MTSVERHRAAHWRGGSTPASTSSDSALRRMRVARWSSRNRFDERVGVGLVALELGDEVELAAEEVLVAAAEVDEAVGDVAAQHGLLDGQVERPSPARC